MNPQSVSFVIAAALVINYGNSVSSVKVSYGSGIGTQFKPSPYIPTTTTTQFKPSPYIPTTMFDQEILGSDLNTVEYQTGNGIYQSEKTLATPNGYGGVSMTKSGAYAYTSPDDMAVNTQWYSDETGFNTVRVQMTGSGQSAPLPTDQSYGLPSQPNQGLDYRNTGNGVGDFSYSPVQQASGYSGPVQSSGYSGPVQSSGYSGLVQFSGDSGPVQFSGDSGPAQSSGYSGPVQFSGDFGPVQSSGYSGPVQSSGYSGPVQSSGYSGPVQFSGDFGPVQSSGYSAPEQTLGYSPFKPVEYSAPVKPLGYYTPPIQPAAYPAPITTPGYGYTRPGQSSVYPSLGPKPGVSAHINFSGFLAPKGGGIKKF